MATPTGPRRTGGAIRRRNRMDRDGDLVMGVAPKAPRPTRPALSTPNSASLTELKVTGWTDKSEVPNITHFLEKHAAKRSIHARRSGPVAQLIKKHRIEGDGLLILRVKPEDVVPFSKINGFTFTSKHGNQKLTIAGPGIRPREGSPTNSASKPTTATESSETLSLKQQFLQILGRRYNVAEKLLDLSTLATDEDIQKTGMFDKSSTSSKFFPALMAVLDKEIKTEAEKREAIHSVKLNDNNLSDLALVFDLAVTLPHIKNLDLSSNKFTNTKALGRWKNKFRNLEHIVITNNPLEVSQPGWEQELITWFPRLRQLNGQQVRTDAEIALLDKPKHTPVPSQKQVWFDPDKIAENFLLDFFPSYDSSRDAVVQRYYDSTSTFSLSVNTAAHGGSNHEKTPWDSYIPLSRNIRRINNSRPRFSRKHIGVERIQRAWAQLPPTRHPSFQTDMQKYSMNCQTQASVPDPTGQHPGLNGLIVTVHGEYEEHRTAKGANEIVRRCFDRTFILGPGGATGVRVVSDMLCLRAYGGVPAWTRIATPSTTTNKHQPVPVATTTTNQLGVATTTTTTTTTTDTVLTPEQQQLVLYVSKETNMTLDYSKLCLESANWDLQQAAELFTAQRGSLPAEAFITTI
ncbi:uncharacterized protein BDR25DRAFT_305211 [Lindgomyces ingoldianus]|uniref:Uncharacterized protein n=1 Tax=Lindgomyces ingoldianus TaxID=673940 RepID=A0ACB6QMR5_9PLEO|nr:uncharacterized protein BDR25DRAFT_305211 [Lindgomyces ingoldianus]KAF2468228.1 hypothetical protein BDR25DRAFT_305211 [Lindgomyces ingoldianus]